MIFSIAGVDCSNYINRQKYDINQRDETESWTDANYRKHTTVIRRRISGTVVLLFQSETEYQFFLNVLDNSADDGYWPVDLYVANKHDIFTITARIDTEAVVRFTSRAYGSRPVLTEVTLSVEEQ